MNPPPFVSKHKYYGDEWLDFHDTLDSLTDQEGIFIELTFQLGLINPRELAYKIGGKENLLNSIKCMIECNREPNKLKHEGILKKYHIVTLPSPKNDKNESMYG